MPKDDPDPDAASNVTDPPACPTEPGESEETGRTGAGNVSPGGASRTGGATTGVAPPGDQADRSRGLPQE